jgi:glutamate/tyrosine decarboxylase-like PLP-dependent enzyme
MPPTDPIADQDVLRETLTLVLETALAYQRDLDSDPARVADAEAAAEWFGGALPERGAGAGAALRTLIERGMPAAIRSSGPRMFHFVTGGTTPAALAADWLTGTLDQNAFSWVSSPLAARLETVALAWLRDLFGLPAAWGGVLTTGATMANLAGLAAARRWVGLGQGVDIDEQGLGAIPPIDVLSSGYLHASAVKALSILGIGRARIRRFALDGTGRADLTAMEDALRALGGRPAIIVGNAGQVDTGAFDPLDALADLAERHGAWLHVDGAFGLFARVSPRTAGLAAGVERARSVIADGHKWLNVPYDCGFAFVRDASLLGGAFTIGAAYLPDPADPRPTWGYLGPEMSRRARALPVWATLAAYGREGYRVMVERQLDLAERLAARVDAAPDLERLADVPLDVVCFRYRPDGRSELELDDLNARLGAAVLEDGRVYVGTTRHAGRVAFRPAIVNWRTGADDVDLLVDVIRDLGGRLAAGTGVPSGADV